MAYADGRITLGSAISATPSTGTDWAGGRGVFSVPVATFGGGTVKLQWSPDDGTTWLDVGTDTTLTAAGAGAFELPPCKIRVNIATATAVTAYAHYTGPI
jgi:hypothetical protein